MFPVKLVVSMFDVGNIFLFVFSKSLFKGIKREIELQE